MKLIILFLFSFSLEAAPFCDGAPGEVHINSDGSSGGFVATTAHVEESVIVEEFASVCDKARVFGNVKVKDFSRIYGRSKINGNVIIKDEARVYGRAIIVAPKPSEQVYIQGNSKVFGFATVRDNARIGGSAELSGYVKIKDDGRVCEDYKLKGSEEVRNSFKYCARPLARINISYPNGNEIGSNVLIDAGESISGDGDELYYRWIVDGVNNEGIGTSSQIETKYLNQGRFFVNLEVVDSSGRSDEVEAFVKIESAVNTAPVAIIEADHYETNKNELLVKFDATKSKDSDEGDFVSTYLWEFGDGETSTEVKPVHLFKGKGIYLVNLKVEDSEGKSGTSETYIEVNCKIEYEGDNSCPTFKSIDEKVLPISSDNFEFDINKSGIILDKNSESSGLWVEFVDTGEEYDFSDVISISGNSIYLKKKDLLTKIGNTKSAFKIKIHVTDINGKFHQGSIVNVKLGSSAIEFKSAKEPTILEISSSENSYFKEIISDTYEKIELSDLPSGRYDVVYTIDKDEYFTSLYVNAFSKYQLELKNDEVNVKLENRIVNSDALQMLIPLKNFDKKDGNSDFEKEKEVLGPLVKEASLNNRKDPLIVDTSLHKEIEIGHKFFTYFENSKDNISIYVHRYRKKGNKIIIGKPFLKKDFSLTNVLSEKGDGPWQSFIVKIPKELNSVAIVAYVTNNTKTPKPNEVQCGSGVFLDYRTSFSKPRITKVYRSDGNGIRNEKRFFPTTVDDDPEFLNTFQHDLGKEYLLQFDVEVERSIDQSVKEIIVGIQGFRDIGATEKIDLFRLKDDIYKPIEYDRSLIKVGEVNENNRVKELHRVTFSFRKGHLSRVNFLSTWDKKDARLVKFSFRGVVSQNEKVVLTSDFSKEQVPLYDAKKVLNKR
ncbi:MAG: PKD repeat protein/carbonic anhydrase/acetyltransferase-like protein (isoleucine patch superfamily), partial [Bacteriovoracaceae bacterium]